MAQKFAIYHMSYAAYRDGLDDLGRKVRGAEQSRAVLTAAAANQYRHCADVVAEDLDDAYRLTNNIDAAWVDDRAAVVFCATERDNGERKGQRSTSIGDLIVSEDGTVHIVATFGFTDLHCSGIVRARLENYCTKGNAYTGSLYDPMLEA